MKKLRISSVLTLLSIICSIFLIYQIFRLGPIEQIIRFLIIIFILLINILVLIKNQKLINSKKRNKKSSLFITSLIIYIIITIFLTSSINKIYTVAASFNKHQISYSTSLLTKNHYVDTPSKIKNYSIGIFNDENSIANYIIPKEIIKEFNLDKNNTIQKYYDLTEMVTDLYQGKIQYIFIDSNYSNLFTNIGKFENISNELKEIYKKEKTTEKINSKNDLIKNDNQDLNKPFSILLMGVDSEKDGLNKNTNVHGDSLILITFNPKTFNITMLTIPRDSYVPIVCFKDKRRNKLTHAAWYGNKCMIDSIQNFLDININYFVKINFKGLVKLVDTIGGITAEVPKDLCTDNSSRIGKICIKKGVQKLNGEGALVLARNRYDLPNGDLDRGQNQQLVLKAIINKIKDIRDINTFSKLIETISNNMDTNLTTNQILSFYNIGKELLVNHPNTLNIEQLYLEGKGQMIYDNVLKSTMWDYTLNEYSLEDVVKSMKNNLNINKDYLIKDFSYSINKPYVVPTTGKGNYKVENSIELIPNFVGKTKEDVEKWKKNKKINVNYLYIKDNNNTTHENTIIEQSVKAKTELNLVKNITIKILEKDKKITKEITKDDNNEKITCEKNNNKSKCLLPSFTNKEKKDVEKFFNNFTNKIDIKYIYLYNKDKNYKKDSIIKQNYKESTNIYKIDTLIITIKK